MTPQHNSESRGTKNGRHWCEESAPTNQNKASPFLYLFDTHTHPLLWFVNLSFSSSCSCSSCYREMDCWSPLTTDDEFEKLVIRMNPPRWIYLPLFFFFFKSFNVWVFVWIEKGCYVFTKFSFPELKIWIFKGFGNMCVCVCVISFSVCV
jgi:hypothetical protein